MFRLIRKFRKDRETREELRRLSDRELADIGISRCDIATMKF